MATTTSDRRLVTLVLVLLGALAILPILFMGFGLFGGGPMMGGGMWSPGMRGGGTIPGWAIAAGFVMQLLFLAVIVGAGYLLYRAVVGRSAGRDPALEELRRAYARGDLDQEEYESRRRDLERED
jgi:putative membrane protein